VTLFADRLQILIVVGAAFELGHLVIDLSSWSRPAVAQAGLAQSLVPAQDALSSLLPLSTIATALTAAASLVGKLAELAICLMIITVARAITH
jgi:hypothetical protein